MGEEGRREVWFLGFLSEGREMSGRGWKEAGKLGGNLIRGVFGGNENVSSILSVTVKRFP